jgi:hypothetical protein
VIYSIDPGTEKSALVVYDGSNQRVVSAATLPNEELLRQLPAHSADKMASDSKALVIEQIESMGGFVGKEVFETVFWSGRFYERWQYEHNRHRITRRAVKMHLAGTMKANDSSLRYIIYERYGGKDHAVGRKKAPGPLFLLRAHEYAALAVAITFAETR